MKKILSFFIFLSICSVKMSSQVSDILGAQDVFFGESPIYHLYFDNLTQDTQFVLSISYGTFKGSTDSTKIINISKGTARYDFYVTWGNTKTNNGLITVYKSGSNTKKTLKVKIADPVSSDITIDGPQSISRGNVAQYKLSPDADYVTPTWRTNSSNISIVSDANAKSVSVKANKGSGTAVLYVDMKNGYGSIVQTLSKTITLAPNFEINTSISQCCANDLINYTVSDLNGASIVWQAVANSTLVSGQGSDNVTFRASGNGYAIVKAIVSYNGQNISIENSKVWVGVPEFENAYDAVIVEAVPNMSYAFKFNVPGNDTGENTYTWSITGPAKISWTNNSGGIQFVTNPGKGGLVSITGSVRNKCGKCTKDQWIEAFVRSNGGGIDGGLKSQALIPLSDTEPVSIKVYSFSTGYLLYQEKNTINFNIQNTNLKPDIYILETTDSQGNVTREKVAKSNR